MKKKVLALFVSFSMMFGTVPAYAHSGRTDSAGGHHDYNNVSGLGSYHYHHGYPAHLHKNGVCPYASNTTTTKPTTTTTTTKPTTTTTTTKPTTTTTSNVSTVTANDNRIAVTRNSITVYVNNNKINADNFVYNDTTYIPIRAVGNALNATIDYNAITKSVNITVPKQTNTVVQTVTKDDVTMSNYVIATAYASNIQQTMLFILDNLEQLPKSANKETFDTLENNLALLKNYADFMYQCNIDILYPLADCAYSVIDNAERCENLTQNSTINENFYNQYSIYYEKVIDAVFSGCKIATDLNFEAIDYAVNK